MVVDNTGSNPLSFTVDNNRISGVFNRFTCCYDFPVSKINHAVFNAVTHTIQDGDVDNDCGLSGYGCVGAGIRIGVD